MGNCFNLRRGWFERGEIGGRHNVLPVQLCRISELADLHKQEQLFVYRSKAMEDAPNGLFGRRMDGLSGEFPICWCLMQQRAVDHIRVDQPYKPRGKHIMEEHEQNETIHFAFLATCKNNNAMCGEIKIICAKTREQRMGRIAPTLWVVVALAWGREEDNGIREGLSGVPVASKMPIFAECFHVINF